jgi:NhaP-type Na+/H+ or K+/H+ antiporter
MNDIVNKWAMGLAIFSFGFLCIGSFLFGATATTSVLRGVGGGILFGAILWLVGALFDSDSTLIDEDVLEENINTEESTVKDKLTDL